MPDYRHIGAIIKLDGCAYSIKVSDTNWDGKTRIIVWPSDSKGKRIDSSLNITPKIIQGLEKVTLDLIARFGIDFQDMINGDYFTETPRLCEGAKSIVPNYLSTQIHTPKKFTSEEVKSRLELFNGNVQSIITYD